MSEFKGKREHVADLVEIARKYNLPAVLNVVKELEFLRNKVGMQRNTIKKKQHVIDTVNHHNNRLANENRAAKYALGAKFLEVEELTKKLEGLANDKN